MTSPRQSGCVTLIEKADRRNGLKSGLPPVCDWRLRVRKETWWGAVLEVRFWPAADYWMFAYEAQPAIEPSQLQRSPRLGKN